MAPAKTPPEYVKWVEAEIHKVLSTPDMKEKVATAMADKYWLDILIRHESHPMVARLVPEAAPPQTLSH